MTTTTDRGVALPPADRSAMVKELFAIGRALHPDGGMQCFCGSDSDLLRALADARSRYAAHLRERGPARSTASQRSAPAPRDRGREVDD